MPNVVFACVHNAGRSQIAAAWFNHLASTRPLNSRRDSRVPELDDDAELLVAVSAGTSPADRVHPEVVEVMKELGIDLSSAVPQKLTPDLLKDTQLLVTLGCGDRCPYVPGLKTEDWPLEDPKGKSAERVRAIREEICRRVEDLLRRI